MQSELTWSDKEGEDIRELQVLSLGVAPIHYEIHDDLHLRVKAEAVYRRVTLPRCAESAIAAAVAADEEKE